MVQTIFIFKNIFFNYVSNNYLKNNYLIDELLKQNRTSSDFGESLCVPWISEQFTLKLHYFEYIYTVTHYIVQMYIFNLEDK